MDVTQKATETNAIDEVNELFARSFERAQRGRRQARILFLVPLIVLGVAVFLFVAAPGFSGGMHSAPAWTSLIIAAPAAAIPLGLLWMWRIMRSAEDPEMPRGPFRYRSPRG